MRPLKAIETMMIKYADLTAEGDPVWARATVGEVLNGPPRNIRLDMGGGGRGRVKMEEGAWSVYTPASGESFPTWREAVRFAANDCRYIRYRAYDRGPNI